MAYEPFEAAKLKLYTVVKGFHDAQYPALTDINYPNLFTTDVEHVDELVTIEIRMDSRQLEIGNRRAVRVSGELVFNHFIKEGAAPKPLTTYSDRLFDYLGLKTLDGITYYEVKPYSNKLIPGFTGIMNMVDFQMDYIT